MRAPIYLLLACTAACSFTKDPYLFTSLADVPLIVVPDGSVVVLEDAGDEPDAGETPDTGNEGLDAELPDAMPVYVAGNALQLDQLDEGANGFGAGFLPHGGAARTIEAWIKNPTGPMAGSLVHYGGGMHRFEFKVVNSDGLNGRLIFVDGFDVALSETAPVGDQNWHHVAMTLTATAPPDSRAVVSFYVDGVFSSSTSKGNNDVLREESHHLFIGGIAADPQGFSSLEIDEVRLWSIARSPAEIARDLRQRFENAPGLVGYWAMDEVGAGPGLPIPNKATATGTTAAPSLFTNGGVSFIESTAF